MLYCRGELAGRTGGLAGGEGKAGGGDPAVAVELSEHGRQIQQINEVLHFQVSGAIRVKYPGSD